MNAANLRKDPSHDDDPKPSPQDRAFQQFITSRKAIRAELNRRHESRLVPVRLAQSEGF